MKIVVALGIETEIEVADTGYMGPDATVAQHLDHVMAEVANWRFLVVKGQGHDGETIRVHIKPRTLTILPE